MLNVLYIYLVNICLIVSILYMLYRSLVVGPAPGSRQGRGRLRKYSLPLCTHAPSTTSAMPASSAPATDASSAPSGHSPHTQKFVMIPNFGYVESRPQPSFLP